jgi:transaldolase
MKVDDLKVKIFADGASLSDMLSLADKTYIKGFTTNPTLMRQANVSDYVEFAQAVLQHITDRPISFEVFSDEFDEMERQARLIAGWADNVYVKIPVTNTRAEVSYELISRLAHSGVKVNVTAVFTLGQVREVSHALLHGAPSVVSVFAGRIADAGVDPVAHMCDALEIVQECPSAELLWASPRELLNVVQADQIGCHIITVTSNLLAKLSLLGKDLEEFSLDTVKMFYNDAQKAQYKL